LTHSETECSGRIEGVPRIQSDPSGIRRDSLVRIGSVTSLEPLVGFLRVCGHFPVRFIAPVNHRVCWRKFPSRQVLESAFYPSVYGSQSEETHGFSLGKFTWSLCLHAGFFPETLPSCFSKPRSGVESTISRTFEGCGPVGDLASGAVWWPSSDTTPIGPEGRSQGIDFIKFQRGPDFRRSANCFREI